MEIPFHNRMVQSEPPFRFSVVTSIRTSSDVINYTQFLMNLTVIVALVGSEIKIFGTLHMSQLYTVLFQEFKEILHLGG